MKYILSMMLSVLLLFSNTPASAPKGASVQDLANPIPSPNDAPPVTAEQAKSDYGGLLHTDGSSIIAPNGEPTLIKGISLGNDVYQNRPTAPLNHHTEETYQELAEMGFNSVRFYLNYGLFEDDDKPYVYKEEGFDWIDRNVQWAKKYGIGIIFNMHYPQGGYQSQGKGEAFWDEVSNQDRLSALWCEIASRYKDEPTVWGYGLVNEPVISWQGSKEETLNLYKNVMQRLVNDLREVTNQAIFVEKLCAVIKDEGADWSVFSAEESMILLEGENLVYEFHTYTPHSFTHQDMDWANTKGKTAVYPDESNLQLTIDNYWLGCLPSKKISSVDGWEYYEASAVYTGDEAYNIGSLAINARGLGEDGIAYFDDLTVREISPEGRSKTLISVDFQNKDSDAFRPWSADGSGKISYVKNVGHTRNGCIKIEGTLGDYTATYSTPKFVLKKGYTYKVSGYIKCENADRPASVRIDYAHATEITTMNIDYLERGLMPALAFRDTYNVPIYLGEFGACNNAFLENRGGDRWVSDMLALCRKHALNFNYHTYHEGNFGLHTSSGGNTLPTDADLNKALYNSLVDGLKNG